MQSLACPEHHPLPPLNAGVLPTGVSAVTSKQPLSFRCQTVIHQMAATARLPLRMPLVRDSNPRGNNSHLPEFIFSFSWEGIQSSGTSQAELVTLSPMWKEFAIRLKCEDYVISEMN